MGRYSPRRSRSPPRCRPQYSSRSSRRHSPPPFGLLVRNISLDARPDDFRIPFERSGPVKDVYLPRNYYTGEPWGFGFVKFHDPEDAIEAKHQMNHTVIGGCEIIIVFAEENRKTPQEMRTTSRGSGRYGGSHRRRSPPRSPRRRYHFDKELKDLVDRKKVIMKEWKFTSIHIARSRKVLDWNSRSLQLIANKSFMSEFKEMMQRKLSSFWMRP